MTEFIGCPVTSDDLAKIDALIIRTGQTRSEWLHALVQNALAESPTNIRHLTERVAQLEQQNAILIHLQQQVEDLTRQVKRRQPEQSTQPLPTTQPLLPIQPMENLVNDDVEDEPDEVLYDFLEPDPMGEDADQVGGSIYDADDEPDEVLYDFLDENDRPF